MFNSENRKYYVYVLLDSRKMGKYSYKEFNMSFLYEPFYIGKGSGNRLYDHKKYAFSKCKKNGIKTKNKVEKILKTGYNIIPVKIYENMSGQEAYNLEVKLINVIGINNLTNIRTDIYTSTLKNNSTSTKEKISNSIKEKYSNDIEYKNKKYKISQSKEYKEKVSLAQKERYLKYGESPLKGTSWSEENKQKLKLVIPKGSKHGMSKLKEEDIPKIRQMREEGLTHEKIADQFKVDRTLIGLILKKKIWSHV